jgi:prepilin-type processing-associated H-X9-DG protein
MIQPYLDNQDMGRLLLTTYYPMNSKHMPMTPDFQNDVPFGSSHKGGANFLFCDGHIGFLLDEIDTNLYQAFSTRAGREAISTSY